MSFIAISNQLSLYIILTMNVFAGDSHFSINTWREECADVCGKQQCALNQCCCNLSDYHPILHGILPGFCLHLVAGCYKRSLLP